MIRFKATFLFLLLSCVPACGRQVMELGLDPGSSPSVLSSQPLRGATGVASTTTVAATFSQEMNRATITSTTFTLAHGTANVPSAVAVNAAGTIATLSPDSPLERDLVYTATISRVAMDTEGRGMGQPYSFSFTTAHLDVAPAVASTTPANLAVAVSRNVMPSATFSQAMDPASIDTTTFTLSQGAGAVSGSVSLNSAADTATFTPDDALLPNRLYTASVTTRARGSNGLALADDYVWTFTSAATNVPPVVVIDEPPSVLSTLPEADAVDVALPSVVSAVFSEPMDGATITDLTFTLADGVADIPGSVLFDALTQTARFTPDAALEFDVLYTASLDALITDSAGTPLVATYAWSFATAPDEIGPTVVNTVPAPEAPAVSIGSTLAITFSEPVDALTLGPLAITLAQDGTPVSGTIALDGPGTTVTFTPDDPLVFDLVYTATVLGTITDRAGNALGGQYVWSFTVAADDIPPTVVSTSPASAALNVASAVTVSARFNEALNIGTLTDLTFTLDQAGTPIAGVVGPGLGNRVSFVPNTPLELGLVYTATLSTGVTDLVGNALAAGFSWSFTIAPDDDPPVGVTAPDDDAIDVSINTRPSATFSRAMDPTTINELSFTLVQGLNAVTGRVSLDEQTNRATFTPDDPLALNQAYTATIGTLAADLGGSTLAADLIWTFTTSACSQLPVVLGNAGHFAVLAGSTVTSSGLTEVTGDLGVSPGTAVVGFGPGTVDGSVEAGTVPAAAGIASLSIAYTDAAGRVLCPDTKIGNLGGQSLPPGLYKSTSGLEITSGDLTLDAQGDPDAVFIFQMASTLTTTAERQIILSGGANPANIFWQVGTSATLGTTSVFFGTIMADQSITLDTGASLTGRALARIAAVSLGASVVTLPAP